MSIRPVKRVNLSRPTHGGRGRAPAPRLRLRRHVRLRSVPDDGRFPRRRARGLSGRLSLASASRHRDDHLCAGGLGRARRQPRQSWQARRGRRAVDDRRQRHHAPGNAGGRRQGPHARLPALGEPAREPQDDEAALPGRAVLRDPRSHRRRRHDGARHLRRVLGQDRPGRRRRRRAALSRRHACRPARQSASRSRTIRQAFAYIFEGSADFSDASEPFGVLREAEIDGQDVLVRDRVGNRSLVVFGAGDEISVQAGEEGVRFLLVSGRPLREPIAWHGPIVMNTRGRNPPGDHGPARRLVHQARLNIRSVTGAQNPVNRQRWLRDLGTAGFVK